MNQETIERLLALNRTFYTTFAASFAQSRPVTDPALTPILPYIPPRASVLDVGCGNGRLALLLGQERPGSTYVGVDLVAALIERARAQTAQVGRIDLAFLVADIARPNWTVKLPERPFERVVALALLHHIPSFALRARIVGDMAGLLEPDGRLILSTWQFLANERMRRKIIPWDSVGLSKQALEPGDYLLDWKRGGYGRRYCHLVNEGELDRLAASSGLVVTETFRAGGREGDLSLFAILDRKRGPHP